MHDYAESLILPAPAPPLKSRLNRIPDASKSIAHVYVCLYHMSTYNLHRRPPVHVCIQILRTASVQIADLDTNFLLS